MAGELIYLLVSYGTSGYDGVIYEESRNDDHSITIEPIMPMPATATMMYSIRKKYCKGLIIT